MAPSQPNFHEMTKRQDTTANSTETGTGGDAANGIPACVVSCIGTAPTTGCSGPSDWTCLCASDEFIIGVGECWTKSCSAADAQYGQAYANQACAFYGVPIGGSSSNTTTSSNTTSSDTQASSTPALAPPTTIHHSFIKVQAIMSSITSLLLVIAIILGILSCRARYKREQATSQNRTWNGVTGLTTMDSKAPSKSRFFNKSTHSSAFENSRSATTTFQSENFGVTSSNFGGSTTLAPASASASGGPTSPTFAGSGRFTNRLTLNELNNKFEEWELNHVKKDELDGFNDISPTSFESKMENEMESRLNETETDNDNGIDSTIALNVLPKEGQGRTHAM